MYQATIVVLLAGLAFAYSGLLRNPFMDNRIIGGQTVDITDFPYQTALFLSNSYRCGGIIISEKWILTAAHCLV